MDGRDAFLTMARERHYEFSSLRRCKYSTMSLLYELHTQGNDKFVYTCNSCNKSVETRYVQYSIMILFYIKNWSFPPDNLTKHLALLRKDFLIKFIYSEKATKFCKIFSLLLSYVVPVKNKVKILQNFVAFSEYNDFNRMFFTCCRRFLISTPE